jgi:hypothetical protein
MTPKLFCKFFVTLTVILSIGCIIGCTALTSTPTSELLATATLAACQPSRIQTSKIKFPEIQGTMITDGEMWALLFFDKVHAKEDVKIVWRMTGSDKQFTVVARHEDGTVISPIWGPDNHGGSNWDHPGYEWGTGFNFPKPGCWTLTATRGKIIGEIRLDILPP